MTGRHLRAHLVSHHQYSVSALAGLGMTELLEIHHVRTAHPHR